MTTQEKYNALLEELGELLANKNSDISILRWQLSDAERKLKELEAENVNLKAKLDGTLCKAEIGGE